MYNKRVDCQEWKGPGVVIGQDAVVIVVRPQCQGASLKESKRSTRGLLLRISLLMKNDTKDTLTDTNLPDVTSNDMDTN